MPVSLVDRSGLRQSWGKGLYRIAAWDIWNRYNLTLMRTMLCVILAVATAASGAELILPSAALERDGRAHAILRTVPLATGRGELAIEWTDAHGRVVDRRTIPVELNDETDIGFDLDLSRAAAIENELHARLVFDGQDKRASPITAIRKPAFRSSPNRPFTPGGTTPSSCGSITARSYSPS